MDRISRIGRWLYQRAENIQALMLGVMFFAFMAQVTLRYLFNFSTGWSFELTVVMWLWMVLWGAAFVAREEEEIRFDLLYGSVRESIRRIFTVITSLALVGLYLFSLPAVLDYVLFMKVQSTAYLKIRFDYLFSIYILFVAGVVCRYVWILWHALRNRPRKQIDDPKTSSTL